jgi:hypothetical protein
VQDGIGDVDEGDAEVRRRANRAGVREGGIEGRCQEQDERGP